MTPAYVDVVEGLRCEAQRNVVICHHLKDPSGSTQHTPLLFSKSTRQVRVTQPGKQTLISDSTRHNTETQPGKAVTVANQAVL
jgi:hypothetical protein